MAQMYDLIFAGARVLANVVYLFRSTLHLGYMYSVKKVEAKKK